MNLKTVSPRATVLALLIAIWGIFVLYKFYNLSEFTSVYVLLSSLPALGGIFRHPALLAGYGWSLIVSGALIFSSFMAGAGYLGVLQIRTRSAIEEFVISTGLGLGAWSLLTFSLGLAGWLRPLLFNLIFWGATLWSAWYFYRRPRPTYEAAPAGETSRDYFSLSCVVLLGLLTAINLASALVPEIHYDALFYHLALPSLYQMHGRIANIPFNSFSYFPQNMEMLYLLGLMVGNDTVTRLLHLFMGVGSALVIYVIGRRYFSRQIAVIATTGFYFVPQVVLENWTAMNDLGVTYFVLLSLLCLLIWLEDGPSRRGYLSLTAVYAGLAVGTKYISVPIIFITPVLLWYYKRSWRQVSKFLLIVALLMAPLLIKNAVFSGSPLAPFVMTGASSAASPDFRNVSYLDDCQHPRTLNFREILIGPWTSIMDQGSLNSLVGPLFLVFLPFLFLLFLQPGKNRATVILFAYLAAYFVFWRTQSTGWRFFLPALPVFCLLIGASLYQEKMDDMNRRLLKFVIMAVMLGNMALVCAGVEQRNTFAVLSGQQTKEAYLRERHPYYPTTAYPVIEYINQNLPLTAKVLFVGETRGYYCRRDFIANSAFDVPTFQKYYKAANSGAQLAAELKNDGITHILFSEAELYRVQKQYVQYDFNHRDLQILQQFWPDFTKQLYFKNSVGLYLIK